MSNMSGASSPPQSQSAYYEKLVRFYEFYAPDKLPTAAITLRAYEGREEVMFRALEKKYGPMAAVPPAKASRPAAAYSAMPPVVPSAEHRAPASGNPRSLTDEVAKSKSSGSALPASVAVDVNPPTAPNVLSLHFDVNRVRLERFYTHYAPEKLAVVQTALEAYAGREETMFRLLEKKYGPEPTAFVVVSPQPDRNRFTTDDDEDEPDNSDSRLSTTAGLSDRRPRRNKVHAGERVAPKSIGDPVPYDYYDALITAGFLESAVEGVLTSFGSDKEQYAAAVCIILTIVGHDALFDPATELQFPVSKLRHVKKCEPDVLDEIAFQHICTYKDVFVAALEHAAHIRQMEALERSAILKELKLGAGMLSYRRVVLSEALKYIAPIEEERRAVLNEDERLRREGLVLWFRQRRHEIVASIGDRRRRHDERDDGGNEETSEYWTSRGGPEGHLDALEQRFKLLCMRQKQQSDAIRERWCARANVNLRTELRSHSPSHREPRSRSRASPDGASPVPLVSEKQQSPPNEKSRSVVMAASSLGATAAAALTQQRSASLVSADVTRSTSVNLNSMPVSSLLKQSGKAVGGDVAISSSHKAIVADGVDGGNAAAAGRSYSSTTATSKGSAGGDGARFNLLVSARAKTVAKQGSFSRLGLQ